MSKKIVCQCHVHSSECLEKLISICSSTSLQGNKNWWTLGHRSRYSKRSTTTLAYQLQHAETVPSIWPSTHPSSGSYSVVITGYTLDAFKQTHKVRPKTPQDLLEFFQSTFTSIIKFWWKWLILSYHIFMHTFHTFPADKTIN